MTDSTNFTYEIERTKKMVMILSYVMDIHAMTFDSVTRLSMASEMATELAETLKDLSIDYAEYLNGIRKRTDEPVP